MIISCLTVCIICQDFTAQGYCCHMKWRLSMCECVVVDVCANCEFIRNTSIHNHYTVNNTNCHTSLLSDSTQRSESIMDLNTGLCAQSTNLCAWNRAPSSEISTTSLRLGLLMYEARSNRGSGRNKTSEEQTFIAAPVHSVCHLINLICIVFNLQCCCYKVTTNSVLQSS